MPLCDTGTCNRCSRRKLKGGLISNIGSNIGQQEWSSDLLSTRNYRYPWWHNHELEEHSLRTASSIVPWFQLLRITLLPCHFATLLTCSALLPAFTLFPCHLSCYRLLPCFLVTLLLAFTLFPCHLRPSILVYFVSLSVLRYLVPLIPSNLANFLFCRQTLARPGRPCNTASLR